jgi:hypothetical protein
MTGVPVLNAQAVLVRRGQVIGRLRDVSGTMEQAGGGLSRISLRGIAVGRPSYWLAEGIEVEATWTLGKGRRSGRIGATLEIMRFEVDSGLVSMAGVAKLQTQGLYSDPMAAE